MDNIRQFYFALACIRPLGRIISALLINGPGLDLGVERFSRQCVTGFFKKSFMSSSMMEISDNKFDEIECQTYASAVFKKHKWLTQPIKYRKRFLPELS